MKASHDHYASPEDARSEARAALLPHPAEAESGMWDGFITCMRYGLPVVALIFGLTTMLWPIVMGEEVSFTLSRDDVSRTNDQLVSQGLYYTGTDARDRKFEIRASSGKQDSPTAPTIELDAIAATMDLDDGVKATVMADGGIYETESERLVVGGKVALATDHGYELELSGVEVRLGDRYAEASGGVRGKTPLGSLSADRMEMDIDKATGKFEGNVRIHIVPDRERKAKPAPPAEELKK